MNILGFIGAIIGGLVSLVFAGHVGLNIAYPYYLANGPPELQWLLAPVFALIVGLIVFEIAWVVTILVSMLISLVVEVVA